MKSRFPFLPALALLAACSSGEPAANPQATEAQQAEMVEQAVRDNYAAQGAEVTDISMARSADGSRFEGRATVRDSAGNTIDVDCRYSQTAAGEPSLECTRSSGEPPEPVVAPTGE